MSLFARKVDLNRLVMDITENTDAETVEALCAEFSRAERLEELFDHAWRNNDFYLLARATWAWLNNSMANLEQNDGIALEERTYSATRAIFLDSQGEKTAYEKFVNKAKWVLWMCYWAAIESDCFLLAACSSRIHKSYIEPKTPFWYVWHLDTDPDFFIKRSDPNLPELLEKGYLIEATQTLSDGTTISQFKMGPNLPEIPAPLRPHIKWDTDCPLCSGYGKITRNQKQTNCDRCKGKGTNPGIVKCPTCEGRGATQGDIPALVIGGNPIPCGECDQTGWVEQQINSL